MPIALIVQLIELLPGLISAGVQVEGLIAHAVALAKVADAKGRAPTEEEWQALVQHAMTLKAAG